MLSAMTKEIVNGNEEKSTHNYKIIQMYDTSFVIGQTNAANISLLVEIIIVVVYKLNLDINLWFISSRADINSSIG